jgi:hypothetical protein
MSYNISGINSGFVSLSSAGLVAGSNAGTYQTGATLTYTNDGKFLSKSATNNIAFTAGHTALGNSQACLFGVWIDAAGNFSTSQGPIVAAGDPCPVPGAPAANRTLVGLIKVSTSSSQTFTPGTTALGTGNTAAYTNCMTMPGSAQ